MKNFIPYTVPFFIPLLAFAGIYYGAGWVLAGFLFCFVIHPILDFLSGKTERIASSGGSDKIFYDLLVWLYVPLQVTFLIGVFSLVNQKAYTHLEVFGIVLSVGSITGGLGITIAHELVHRRARWERGLGVALLAMVNYSHFRVEHVFGHHKHVATPLDPASARPGESLYAFLPRSIVGSYVSAWKIENKKKNLTKNRMIHYHLTALILGAVVYSAFGPAGTFVFIGQSIVAFTTLEAINYIEHYGLVRREVRPGVYEAVTEMHSWDSGYRLTNWFLFNLGRHAHHHHSPTVPYEQLHVSKNANELRFGYSTEIVLAFFGLNSKASDIPKSENA